MSKTKKEAIGAIIVMASLAFAYWVFMYYIPSI